MVCKQKRYWWAFLAQMISFQSEIEAEIFKLSRVETICSKFNLIMLFNQLVTAGFLEHIGDLPIIRTESLVSLIDFNIKPLITTLSSYTSTSLLDTAMKISSNNPAIITLPWPNTITSTNQPPATSHQKVRGAEPGPRALRRSFFSEHLWPPPGQWRGTSAQGGLSSGVGNYAAFPNSYDNACTAPCAFPSLAFLDHQSYNDTVTTYWTCQSIVLSSQTINPGYRGKLCWWSLLFMKYTFSVLLRVYFLCLSVLSPRKYTKILN